MSAPETHEVPFICPHCDDDYWVKVEQKADGDREFTCPTCQTQTSARGPFEVVGPV